MPPENSPKLPPLRDIIAQYNLKPDKSLGQHFLLDPNLLTRITRAAGTLTGLHIMEIGPGPGGLTRALLESDAASITAMEIDSRAIAALTPLAAAYPGRLKIIEADALKTDITALTPAPRAVIANLPYNIGTPLLISWLKQAAQFQSFTLMFQHEVAQRIVAAPSTPAYGRLSILSQWLCDTDIAFTIPPNAFTPPPQVDSAIVRLQPKPHQPPPEQIAAMERLTAAAFGQRRKMLRSALRPLGGEPLLHRAQIDPTRRAETLTIEEFERLMQATLTNQTP